jgi:hypothetical protein
MKLANKMLAVVGWLLAPLAVLVVAAFQVLMLAAIAYAGIFILAWVVDLLFIW